MKRNVFLRAAACLLVAVVASMSVLGGTWAKYVASATVTASARVAKFEVVEIDKPYVSSSKTWPASREIQLSKSDASVVTFELPLFDYEYASTPSRAVNSAGTLIGGTSVSSSGNHLVVAPGTGHGGAPKHNPNIVWDTTDGNITGAPANPSAVFAIHNKSEVAIRFKIEYDPENSLLPVVNASTGAVTMKKPEAGDLTLPIAIRGYGCNNTGSFRLDEWKADKGPKNLYLSRDKSTAYNGFTRTADGDAWRTLAPGESISNIGVVWIWGYAVTAPTAFTITQPSPPDYYFGGWAYSTWVDAVITAAPNNYALWNGFSSTTILPHLANDRAGNIDRFDTLLGLAAAKGDLNISVAFKITIEQVD